MAAEHQPSPAASAPSVPPAWRVILLLAVVVCVPSLMMMAAAATGAAAPDLKAAMKLTQPQVGLLAGTFFVAAGLSLPFAGRSVDRFGPTKRFGAPAYADRSRVTVRNAHLPDLFSVVNLKAPWFAFTSQFSLPKLNFISPL